MAFGKKARPTVDKDGAALVMRGRDYLADFSGQLGLGIMANLVGQLQYFYTDKVGIAVGSVGIVMAIAKIVDALTDIWFGNIIDHSKGGNMKYYKWMLRMAVPAAAITVLIFTVPIGGRTAAGCAVCTGYQPVDYGGHLHYDCHAFFCDHDCAHTEPTGTR